MIWVEGVGLSGGRRLEVREGFMGRDIIWPAILRKDAVMMRKSNIV